ncbi:MAG: chemotaxis protein CheW [Nitrosomonadales bacterium]|nr:chemotaxis protein CheW [Nitrosomonadales bacterium]
MSIDLSQFHQIFFEEAAEHLREMEALLLGLDVAAPAMDDLNAIFRAAHSVKGGAGTFGFGDMTEVTHILETLLDKLRKQEMTLTDEMVNTFLEAGDVISMQLAVHRGEGEVDAEVVREVCEKLERLTSAQQVAEDHAQAQAVVTEDPGYGFFDDVPAPSPSLQSAPAGSEEADPGYGFFTETPVEQAQREQEQGYGFFDGALAQPLAQAPERTASSLQAIPAADTGRRASDSGGRRASDKASTSQAEASSIRVGVEKVDQLINLMGELVITQAMLAQAAQGAECAGNESLQRSLYQLERNTRDMQEAVMSIRMMPISFVFSRFPRMVRDLAGKLGKQVEMKTIGETTELDKSLIEKISDPMTHLVRNSLDHGIESPEKRIEAGKSPCGTLTLKAYHQGGNVVIEVSDDGGGLNRGKILQKAKERGMPVRDDMSDQEVWALIMEPGFSTAEVVTDVSGRGVGMDVVRRNITELGGRVELDSVEGCGTRVIVRLPLTLAILDGLSVTSGHQTYIIPLNAIIESLPGAAADIKTASGGEEHLLHVRGQYLTIIALHKMFGIEGAIQQPERGILVLLEADSKKIALFVDELMGQHQVVLKSLESNYRKVPYISGATIMGDGKVALILDAAALVRASHEA